MKITRYIAGLLLLVVACGDALATDAISVLPSSVTANQNVNPMGCGTTTSAPSNTSGRTNIISCDTAGNLRTAGGGYEFQATVVPTVQNAAYAAGQSLGGLQTISIGSTNGLSGILTQIQVISKGGSTVVLIPYVWATNPANSTCTDKTNIVISQTDSAAQVVIPQSISMALAVSAQDTATYGAATNLVGNFSNGSSNTNLYVCLVASAAVTPASTTDLRIIIQGLKDQP